MNTEYAAAAFLLLLPLAFNTFFFLLARSFDYPAILRSPTAVILARFQAGGVRLKLLCPSEGSRSHTERAFLVEAAMKGRLLVRTGSLVRARAGSPCSQVLITPKGSMGPCELRASHQL